MSDVVATSMHDYMQSIHEWLQTIDAQHDDSSCVCCCWTCDDMYEREMGMND